MCPCRGSVPTSPSPAGAPWAKPGSGQASTASPGTEGPEPALRSVPPRKQTRMDWSVGVKSVTARLRGYEPS